MKPLLLVLLITSVPVTAGPTEAESNIGVTKALTVGAWRVRSGRLNSAGAKHLQGKSHDRFAYATQTVAGDWTLGVRLIQPIGEAAASPVYYLQGPGAFTPGDVVEAKMAHTSVKMTATVRMTVLPDGTLTVKERFREGQLSYTIGEATITFDLTDLPQALSYIEKFDASLPKPPPEKPKPQPLPR